MSVLARVARQILPTSCSPRCATSSAGPWKNPPNEEDIMNCPHSDALVFFGATGDLAHKKIFPSLQAMIKRGHLNVPVIGVAKAGWDVDQLRARARDSVEKHGGRGRSGGLREAVRPLALCGRRLQRRGHLSGHP